MANCICKLKQNKFNNLFKTTNDFETFAESVSNFCSFITIDANNLTDFKVSPDYVPAPDEWFYLEIDELEALRLKNIVGFNQKQCAKKMKISPSTFQRILCSAYKKISKALINNYAIKINKENEK